MQDLKKTHFLNPNAVRINKSLGDETGTHRFRISTSSRSNPVTTRPSITSITKRTSASTCCPAQATAHIGDESFPVSAGDFIGYRKGGLAHSITNTGTETFRCIVVGERLAHDVGDYTRLNKRIYRNAGMKWNLVDQEHIGEPVAGAKK